MSQIAACIQNITPECRANRTDAGALSEALARIQRVYADCVDAEGNECVTWRISLVRVEEDACKAMKGTPND